MALENRPKYWPARAPFGEVELVRTKARPKPGLVQIWGSIEKTNEVEKELRVVELGEDFMVNLEG